MVFRVSPGVYPRIIDDSLSATYINPSIAGVVGGGLRGPLGPNLVTSYKQRLTQYGPNNPIWGYMLDSADAYLLQGTNLQMNRVVSADATWALGLISNNWSGGIGATAAGTSYTSIPGGSAVDYTEINRDVQDIEFVGQFIAGNTVSVTINTVASATVNFTTDHNTTMQLLQQAVITVLNGIGAGGWADLPVTGATYQILRLISPPAINLVVTTSIAGSTPPTDSIYEADWLTFVVSENPGSWGDGIAPGITNIDQGVSQRVTFSLTSAILTGQTLSVTINGTTMTSAFATDNNTTINNFCAAYATAFPGGSATAIVSGGPNNLQFVVIAPNSTTTLTTTAANVTGTGTIPVVSFRTTLNGTPTTGSFNFVVYDTTGGNTSFTSPDELYLCTYANGTDGLGNPTGLEYVINGIIGATAAASPRVRVVVNQHFSGSVNGPTNVTLSTNTLGLPNQRFLTGGVDGSIPSTQQVVNGWTLFNNPDAITVRILINAGYTDPAVQQEMVSIAANRMDCFPILDMPSASQDVSDAVNFRMNQMDIDSFWGAIYSPDVLIYDAKMGVRRYVPPSGMVAAQYAYNDKVRAEWWSPAGLNRGIIPQALGLRFKYEEGDRDALSAAQINAIRKYGAAWTIWGEYTLQQAMSALQSVAVVRLLITVMTEAASACAYSLFEPNNPYTWHQITTVVNSILAPIETAEGINDFLVQCNSTNNTPDIIDERVCLVAMWIKPSLSILYLRLDGIVTRQSAIFSVEEAASMNQY